MRLNFGIIVFVFCLADCLCGIINDVRRSEGKHDNGKTREGSTEDGTNYSGDRSEASEDVPQKILSMHDLNLVAELVEPSSTIKEKRCPRTQHFVRAVQNSHADPIVGSSTPVGMERRDLHSQLNKKLCTSCMSRQQCKVHNKCDICEKWCTPGESGTVEELSNSIPVMRGDANTPTVGSAHKDNPTESTGIQKVEVASRMGDIEIENMKKIHTIATLKSGQLKETISKLLGIPDTSDIDTLVVWVTTHSNQSPKFFPHYKKQVTQQAEELTQMLNKELNKALQMKRENNHKGFLTNEEIMNVVTYVTQYMDNEGNDFNKLNKLVKTSEPMTSWPEEILPIYPIEPIVTDLNIPRILNPDVIEDTPSVNLVGAKQQKDGTFETPITEGKRVTESIGDAKEVVEASTSAKTGTENVGIALSQAETTKKSAEKGKSIQNKTKKPLIVSPFLSKSDEDGDILATENQVTTDSEENDEEYDEEEDDEEDDSFRTIHGKKKKKHKHGNKIQGVTKFAPIKHRANEASGEGILGTAEGTQSDKNITPSQKIQESAPLQTIQQPQQAQSQILGTNRHSKLKPQSYDQPNLGDTSQNERTMPVDTKSQRVFTQAASPIKIRPSSSTTANTSTSEMPSEKSREASQLKAKTQEILNKIKERVAQKKQGQQLNAEEKFSVSPNTEKMKEKGADLKPTEVVGSVNKAEDKEFDSSRPADMLLNSGQEPIKSQLSEPNLQSLLPPVDNFEKAKAALKDVQKLVEVIQKESNVAQGKQLLGQEQQRVGMPSATITAQGNDLQAMQHTTCMPIVQSSTTSVESGALEKVVNRIKEMPQYIKDKTKDILSDIEGQQHNEIVGQPQEKIRESNTELVGSEPLEEVVSNGDIDKPIFGFSDLTMRRNKERMNLGSPLGSAQNNDFQQVKFSSTQLPAKTSNSQVSHILRKPSPDQSTSQTVVTVPKEFPKNSVHISPTDGKEVLVKEKSGVTAEDGINDSKPSLLGAKPSETLLKASRSKSGRKDIDIKNRGKFSEGSGNVEPWTDALGKFVPSKQDSSLVLMEPKNVYFIGNGIKLPLQIVQKQDGAVHLSVDIDKLCSCTNTSCPKNHTAIEETVETILEKEAELKDQLIDHIVSRENSDDSRDFGDMPLGMATPRFDKNVKNKEISTGREVPHRSVRGIADSTWLGNQLKSATTKIQMRNTDSSTGLLKQPEVGNNSKVNNFQYKENISDMKDILNLDDKTEQKLVLQHDIGHGDIRHKDLSNPPLFKTTIATKGINQDSSNYMNLFTDKSILESKLPNGEGKSDLQQLFFPKDAVKNFLSEIEKGLIPTKVSTTTPPVDKTIDVLLKQKPTNKMQATADGILGKLLLSLKPTPLTSQTRNIAEKYQRGNEVFDELTPVKNVHKFKHPEGDLKSKLKYFNEHDDWDAKEDEKFIDIDAMNLLKIHEDAVVREEVDIMKNFLTWLKNMATDKDRA